MAPPHTLSVLTISSTGIEMFSYVLKLWHQLSPIELLPMVQNHIMSMVKTDLVFSFIRDILSGQRIQFYRQYYFSRNFDCTVLFLNFIFLEVCI